jgi:Amt family ammonium transporter
VSGLIYPVFGHWAWNPDGWLKQLGFIDFAGSTVVHSVGGWCSLIGVLIVGPRLGRYSRRGEVRQIPGHNLPLSALGGFILWIGWFGFNGGSVSSFDQLGPTLLNTHLGGCSGIVAVILYLGITRQPIYTGAVINAGVGGLVSITAGAAYFSPAGAILAGGMGGLIVFVGAEFLRYKGVDDVVDAVAVHGIGGMWGTLAAGLFYAAEPFSMARVGVQLVGLAVALLWTLPMAWLCFKAVDKLAGLRAESEHERRGLDYTEHFELGYGEVPETWQPEAERS